MTNTVHANLPFCMSTHLEICSQRNNARAHYVWDGSSLTCFFWPILWALAMACRSFCGFQSLSKMMTVSAVARFTPRPPARVDSRKQKSCESSALKWSNACLRMSPRIVPSKRCQSIDKNNCIYHTIITGGAAHTILHSEPHVHINQMTNNESQKLRLFSKQTYLFFVEKLFENIFAPFSISSDKYIYACYSQDFPPK